MGSQFMSLHVVNLSPVQARLRGDFPDLVTTLYGSEKPPAEELRPAFELMARGTFVFLPKRKTHPDGLMYCRAFEFLLKMQGSREWGIEFYPDEGEVLWELVFGRCEAEWLDLPRSDSEIALTSWRSPATCRMYANSIRYALREKSFNPRYSPLSSLEECLVALDEGASSGHGLFAIFQG